MVIKPSAYAFFAVSVLRRDFTGGKALYHVVGKDLGASCSCVSDGSEVLACSCAIGSASIRVDI